MPKADSVSSNSRAFIILAWVLAIWAAGWVRAMRPDFLAVGKLAAGFTVGMVFLLVCPVAAVLWGVGTVSAYPAIRDRANSVAWYDYLIFGAGCVGILLVLFVIGMFEYGVFIGR